MTGTLRKEITKEIYDRAMENRGFITSEDESKIFSVSQLCGYGVYMAMAHEENGEYYCTYQMGSTCD